MSVYVDELQPCVPNKNWPWAHSSHLFADTAEELHSFAAHLQLKREWFQDEGYFPHYDLSSRKQALAIQIGAVPLTREAAVDKWRNISIRSNQETDCLRIRQNLRNFADPFYAVAAWERPAMEKALQTCASGGEVALDDAGRWIISPKT